MFDKNVYIQRRNKLKKNLKSGLILFIGNDESPMNYEDNTYHFRQDSTFLYYFGLDEPGLYAIIDVDNNNEIVFGDNLTIDSIVWMGTQPSVSEKAALCGVEKTNPVKELKNYLAKAKNTNQEIHFVNPYRDKHRIKLMNLLDIHPDKANEMASIKLVKAIALQRSIKETREIVEIEKSVNITCDMHIAAMKYARPGMTESQVAAEIQRIAVAAGGQLSFPTIATINGQTLHNHFHGNVIKEGQLMLVDAGAETNMHYAGDMSSTFPVSKKFTPRQKEIYQIALNAHEAAITELRPGVKFKNVHLKAAATIVQGMKEIGLMKGNVQDAVKAGAHAMFFPCGLGHMMGLDVHDMENYGEANFGYDNEAKSTQFGLKSLRLGRELKEGYVLTIEPGIYFIPELIDLWKAENKFTDFINYDRVEQYKGFSGCRNEEDFVITADGARVLGKPVPKTIEDVENLRNY